MSSWEESRGTPARLPPQTEPFFFGPICLIAVAVWLLTIGAWNGAPVRPVPESVAAQFTQTGRMYYRPEYDLTIYLGGLAAAVLVGLGWGLCWRRRWQTAATDAARGRVERRSNRNFWWALGCMALASVSPRDLMLNVLASGFAACAAIVLWANARPRSAAHNSTSPAPKPVPTSVPASGASRNSVATGGARDHAGTGDVSDSKPAGTDSVTSTVHGDVHRGFWWATAAAAAIIAFLVYVPDPATLEAQAWQLDGLMHWNFYLMGPLLAFRHGAALGTDFYTQYSVGWPLLFSALDWVYSVDYRLIFQTVTLWGCIYFMMLFWFLRSLTGRTAWALAGLLLALFLQLYCGTAGPLWMYPSSTILRNPLDVPLFWLCLQHARSGNARYGIGIGCVAGLAVLFGTDTGVYSAAALLFYCGLCFGFRPLGQRLLNFPFVLNTGGAFIAIVVAGLTFASRGTLLQKEFWLGYWESLIFYSGGISALPMHDGIVFHEDFLLLMAALLAYSFAITSALLRWITGRLVAADLVLALVAAFGLETLMVFINRSHPFNLYHPIIPFCILAVAYAARWAETPQRTRAPGVAVKSRSRSLRVAAPAALIAMLLVGLALNQHVRDYPSLLSKFLPQSLSGRNNVKSSADYQDFKVQLRLLSDIFRNLSEGGRYSIALVDPRDTNVLAQADVPPYFRYSPLDPLHYRQVDIIKQRLSAHPPDIILFALYGPPEMLEIRSELLREDYVVDRQEGIWQVLRRVDGAKTVKDSS